MKAYSTALQQKEKEYLPAIVKEYNLILKKESKLPRAKRDMIQKLVEALVKKGRITKNENGEFEIFTK